MVGIATKENDKRKTRSAPMTACKKCGRSLHIRTPKCPDCGTVRFETNKKKKPKVEDETEDDELDE